MKNINNADGYPIVPKNKLNKPYIVENRKETPNN